MKNLIYFFSKPSLKYRLAKNLIPFLAITLILLTQQGCSPTEPTDDKPPVEPDSTTQNFTFETFEFGDGFESSWLNDVWIFDENNIWAVGYVREPITNNNSMNIIRWNGSKWYGFGRQFNSSGIYGIWGLDSANIFFAVGAVVQYKNGSFIEYNLGYLGFTNGQGVHKLWGSSESNIWGVGPGGTIVHYDGTAWSKIEFDINYRFDAITGSKQTGIAYASATSQQFNTIIVELKDNSATTIYNSANNSENLTSFSIEQLNEQELILGTKSVWTFNIVTKETKVLYNIPQPQYVTGISVVSPIDIYFFSKPNDPGENLIHFNGKRYLIEKYSDRDFVIFGNSHAIKDLAVAVGFSNNKGYLVKVKRIK